MDSKTFFQVAGIIISPKIPDFVFLLEKIVMSNIKDRDRYNRFDNQIWKRTRVDGKGQTTLPKKLRQKLGINGKENMVLWISVKHKDGKNNEFLLEVGIKNVK